MAARAKKGSSASSPPPSLGATSARRTNVTSPLSTFVGRTADLARIAAELDGGARVITVLGPGGMGKTRVLLRFAETHGAPFLDSGGVWFCDLGTAENAEAFCRRVAAAFGARVPTDLTGAPLSDYVGELVSELGPALLLCDNFEQLDDASASALEAWCRSSPDLRVLISSRRRLGIAGEIVFELPPLGLGQGSHSESDAVRLFLERVGAHEAHDLGAVHALVRELEGIPLAIELAAARSRVLSPAELVARLARGEDVIASSLAGAVQRSWELLAPWERDALAQCALFPSDFSITAAEAVVDVAAHAEAPKDALDVLGRLRDQSLLTVRRTIDGETRFRMYQSLRDFARRQLAAHYDERGAVARHRAFFVHQGFALATRLWRTGEAAVHKQLGRELENLELVASELVREKSPRKEDRRDLAHVVFAIAPIASITSSFAELLSLLGSGIAAAASEDSVIHGRLLAERGAAYGVRGDNARAIADLDAAFAVSQSAGDDAGAADALVSKSVRLRQQGKLDEALSTATRAGDFAGAGVHPRIEGGAAVVTGFLLGELGRADESRRKNLHARSIFLEVGDPWSEALSHANVAQLDQARGDFDTARVGFDAALAIFRDYGDRRYEARYLGYRAALDHERGDLSRARATYRRALDLAHGITLPHAEALFAACLGALEAAEDDIALAAAELDRAAGLCERVEVPVFQAAIDVHRGHLDLARARAAKRSGDHERVDRSVAAARARFESARFADRSEDVRFALRLLERALRGDLAPTAMAPADRERLVVAPNGFRLGEGALVDLSRRGALRRILFYLVARHGAAPGVASDWQTLLEHGWPGERVLAEAGATRVRVAIATLRKMGLAGVLVTRDDGYLLSERLLTREQNEFNEP